MIQFLAEFLGHFHPVIVHLPIGILIMSAIFYVLARTSRYQALRPAVSLSLFIGMLSAVVACVTGWLLSTSGDYDTSVVAAHQWLAIATTIVSAICYVAERKKVNYLPWTIALLFLMITITGHLGGSLTHGDDYLTAAFDNYSGNDGNIAPIANVQEALVYDDVIRPILSTKCYSCHGKRKQKGGLRLDDKEFILKGGKEGQVLVPGDAGSSELVQRIFLAHENEDHMPPKEKPQPTSAQKDLIKWWVASGASFDKKVRDLERAPDISNTLASLGSPGTEAEVASAVPDKTVDEAPEKILSSLARRGVVSIPVAQNSHYLSVNFVNASASGDSIMALLKSIDKQVVWLKTGTYPVDAEGLKAIAELKSLTRLHIGNLEVSGNELSHLAVLNLQYLNLTGADLADESVNALKNLTSLRQLYLYRCGVSPGEYSELRKSLPRAKIDTGSYVVPTLASDTTEVTTGRDEPE